MVEGAVMKTKIFIVLFALIPFYGFAQSDIAMQQYYQGDYTAAATGLVTLAQSKHSEAAFNLGKMYLQGYGVNKDVDKGLGLILQAAKQNYVPAQLYLARYYLSANNNFNDAFTWFQKAADLGNVEAQTFCATSYLYGYGITKNVEKARKYIIKAAQNGDPLAQYELAKIFLSSKSSKNQALGWLWLGKSAANGNQNGQYFLGVSQLSGINITKNIPQAIKWLKESAVQGNAKARFALAIYYLTSNDGIDNLQLSMYWFNKNAQALNDNAFTQISLNTKQENNDDPKIFLNQIPKRNTAKNDQPLTFAEWLKLAEQGDITAAQQVGFRYARGEGVAVNTELGIKWLSIAAAENNYIAKIQLAEIQKKWLNPEKSQQTILLTPKMAEIDKAQIFNQNYKILNPSLLPIEEIISTLGRLNYKNTQHKLFISTLQLSTAEKKSLKASINEIIREADLGYAQSQFKLGLAYLQGIGVEKNISTAIKWFELSAKQNYLNAEYALGRLAFSGEGMPKNYELAQTWLMQAALKGSAKAQLLLAQLYEVGYGDIDSKNVITKNLIAAQTMYGLAAANNNTQAQYKLAQLYISGLLANGDPQAQMKDIKLAYTLFEQAANKNPKAKLAVAFFNLDKKQSYNQQQQAFKVAEAFASKNDLEGKLLLALMYDRGVGTEVNKEKAVKLYQQLAQAGNPIAQYILGSDYALGIGTQKNILLARNYLAKASTAGLGYANYNLAVLEYQQNNFASFLVLLKLAQEKDYQPASILLADYYLMNEIDSAYTKQAVSIYQGLANNGNIDAQIKLAYMYQNGIYFTTDYQAALDWYQKAADNHNPVAQFALGEMYQVGQGTDRDLRTAMDWYEKAAKQQFAPAQVALGYINEVDRQDYQQARTWYELAAKNDKCPIADYNLALLYDYGKGVPVDITKAKTLYQRAVKQGLQAIN